MGKMRQRPGSTVPAPAGFCPTGAVIRCLALLALLAGAGRKARAAGPAPLALAELPGGALELRSGTAVLARISLATPLLRRAAPVLRELNVNGHRLVEVRVPVRGSPSEEVWIGELGVKPARIIWSGLAGPRDADEETAIAVEVTPERIFEYQTAAQVARCDGEPVHLFPRAWDFGSGHFRPILSTPPPPAPPNQRLIARRDDPAMPVGRPLGGFHFVAASTTAAAGNDARALSTPSSLDDGDPATAWAEGLGGDGRGEFLTARASAGHYRVRGLRIVPGDASSAAAFRSRNRLKTLALAFGSEAASRFDVEFPEDPATAAGKFANSYWIALPEPVDSTCVTVIIRDVYRGSESGAAGGGGTTAISELQIFTELDQPSGVERLVSDMAAGTDCPSRVPLLVALGEPAVLPTAQAILAAKGIGRECLVEALARLDATTKSGVAMDALAAALVGASLNEERAITQTVRKAQKTGSGTAPVHAVVALLMSAEAAPDRTRAARLLGQLEGGEAVAALVNAAGGGEPETRLAIVQALGHAPAATVTAVVSAIDATRGGEGQAFRRREADLLRALPALARRAPAERPAAVAALRRSLRASTAFEVRARAVLALGEVGDPAVVADLSGVRDQSDDPVLRFLAARELGGVGGAAALDALRRALGDTDPRVRETAAQELGHHKDVASEAVLIAAAKDEPWPFARRAQIEALSRTCGPQAKDLLVRAMERDVDEVRRASLVGLVRCRDRRARATLLSTLKNRRASAPLRELAGAMLGENGDPSVTKELAASVMALVNEAEGDLAIEGVTVAALRSLSRLGGAEAARVAAGLSADDRHPYRRVAVESLGELCDPTVGARALGAVRTGKDGALAAQARAAEERCQSHGGGQRRGVGPSSSSPAPSTVAPPR